ncbi:MAG TPA: alpha/beta hydrolase [Gaiellaceae bacterium]
MPEARVNGVSLFYEERGSGDAILGIHGTGSSAAFWSAAAAELATRGRTITYDRRGHSQSERPDPFVTDVHLQADDAAALIDALGASPAVVIGRSHGGEIAVDLALRYPDRVRALVLLEGGGLALSPAFREWLAEVHEGLFAAAEEDAAETLVRRVAGDESWEGLPDDVKELLTENAPALLAEERSGLLDVTAEELGGIAHPTLIVGGRGSPPAFTEVTRLTAEAIPSARVEWVEGGHLIDPAHPAVLAFVDEVFADRVNG